MATCSLVMNHKMTLLARQSRQLKVHRKCFKRSLAVMNAWQVESYDGIGAIRKSESTPKPVLNNPLDVLVKVKASSVNPLDVQLTAGYGKTVLNKLRAASCESANRDGEYLPLTLGRDFSGEIVDVGMSVKDHFDFEPGDQVWGAVFPSSPGSHADYVSVSPTSMTYKPSNLSHIEAASIPYAALSGWAAMFSAAKLSIHPLDKGLCKVLVLGASGGVGSIAVQILNSLRYQVVAVSRDTELVKNLGITHVVDYTSPDFHEKLKKLGPYDNIFDFAGIQEGPRDFRKHLAPGNGKFVTLTSPLLKSIDENGIAFGASKTLAGSIWTNLQMGNGFANFRYAFFTPIPSALTNIKEFVEDGKISPVIQHVFNFSDLPKAYEKVQTGSLRGKVVIDHEQNKKSGEFSKLAN